MSEEKRYAVIREDAHMIYLREQHKRFKGRLPINWEWYNHLKQLAGKKLEVEREYNDRVVLKYPPEMVKVYPDGRKVVAIDLEKIYVRFV